MAPTQNKTNDPQVPTHLNAIPGSLPSVHKVLEENREQQARDNAASIFNDVAQLKSRIAELEGQLNLMRGEWNAVQELTKDLPGEDVASRVEGLREQRDAAQKEAAKHEASASQMRDACLMYNRENLDLRTKIAGLEKAISSLATSADNCERLDRDSNERGQFQYVASDTIEIELCDEAYLGWVADERPGFFSGETDAGDGWEATSTREAGGLSASASSIVRASRCSRPSLRMRCGRLRCAGFRRRWRRWRNWRRWRRRRRWASRMFIGIDSPGCEWGAPQTLEATMPSNRDHIEQGVSGFEAEIEDLQDEVKTLRGEIKVKDEQIKRLETQLEAAENRAEQLEQVLGELRAQEAKS